MSKKIKIDKEKYFKQIKEKALQGNRIHIEIICSDNVDIPFIECKCQGAGIKEIAEAFMALNAIAEQLDKLYPGMREKALRLDKSYSTIIKNTKEGE